jgi:hypothetical protein
MQRAGSVSSGWSSSDEEGTKPQVARQQPSRLRAQQQPVGAQPRPAPITIPAPSASLPPSISALYQNSATAGALAKPSASLTNFIESRQTAVAGKAAIPAVTRNPARTVAESAASGSDSTPTAGTPRKPVRKARKKRVAVNLSRCKYNILREVVEALGWTVDNDVEGLAAFASLTGIEKQREKDTTGGPVWSPAGAGNGASPTQPNGQPAADPVALLNGMVQSERCQIVWSDVSVLTQTVSRLKAWQRVNHFPSMTLICRKVLLSHQLTRMASLFPDAYNFFPLSFSCRSDVSAILAYARAMQNKKTFILKPNAGCQGTGIVLTKHPERVIPSLPHDDYVCQVYIARPLLIERKKFDMRIYVLVLSVTNLKIMIYDEGLIRMCTTDYVKPKNANLRKSTMHLTNYAVNKKSEAFTFGGGGAGGGDSGGDGAGRFHDDGDGSRGSKRDFAFFQRFIEEQFGPDMHEVVWQRIERAVVLTVLSAYHQLRHAYCAANPNSKSGDCRTCFELLGFDVLLDEAANPYVLEVNHSPSFSTDSAIDHRIKRRLLIDTFKHVNPYLVDIKRASDLQYRKMLSKKKDDDVDLYLMGTGYRPIYPPAALRIREEREQRKKHELLAAQAAAAEESSDEEVQVAPSSAQHAEPLQSEPGSPTPPSPVVPPVDDALDGDDEDDDDAEDNAQTVGASSAVRRLQTPEELQQLYDTIIEGTAGTLPGQSSLRALKAMASKEVTPQNRSLAATKAVGAAVRMQRPTATPAKVGALVSESPAPVAGSGAAAARVRANSLRGSTALP